MRRTVLVLLLAGGISVLLAAAPASAQWANPPKTGSQPEELPDRTVLAGQSGMGPLMTAELVHPHDNAKKKMAVVQVHTDGVRLVTPGSKAESKDDEAHLQYRLDHQQAIDTTQTNMRFTGLSQGDHIIQVALAGNDNKPMGHQTTLKVHIP